MKKFRTSELYADLYENYGKPLIVIIGGSKAGLPDPIDEDFLSELKTNYSVLLLAYFGEGDLPKGLEQVSLEYFINAIETVQKMCNVGSSQTIIIGQSKGGEAALLLTKYISSAITIALVASCYVFQGLPENMKEKSFQSKKSSWTYGGFELPYIPFYFDEQILQDIMKKQFCTCYKRSIKENYNSEAMINIDNYSGKIFFISEENDRYWPSKWMMENLIRNTKSKANIEHVSVNLESHRLLNDPASARKIMEYLNKNAPVPEKEKK